ncbi:MAG: putative bifunctional diguanylate cyclase/phosphodiesterase [Microthrixaceae bacterium]
MSRRSRRRAEELARAAADAVAAEQAVSAARAAADAAALRRTRDAYDRALSDSGLVLLQQVAPGVDGYHLSSSLATVLGWDPTAFLNPGILRGMVHPDDLLAFARVLPPPGSARPGAAGEADEAPGGVDGAEPREDELSVIDLTTGTVSSHASRTAPIEATARDAGDRTSDAADRVGEAVVRMRSAQGPWRRMLVRVAADHAAVGLVKGSLVDVTDAEQRHATTRRFAELVEHDPAGALVLELTDTGDPSSLVIRAANPAARRMLDLEHRVVDGTTLDTVFLEASAQLVRSALFDVYHTGESMTAERLSFSEVPGTYLDLRVDRLADGSLGMTIEDVTGTVAVEERLRHQASHDALTSLPNRTLLEERLATAAHAVTPTAPFALIVVDIDRLRDVNESHGLHLGDQLLVELGRRLVRDVRGTAIVSRLGGDEFAVLTLPCVSEGEATERAAAVASALSRPFEIEGHLVDVSASIGVALAPRHGDDARSLLRHAHTALHADKHGDAPFTVYRPAEASSSISRLALLSDLRQGLANQDLELRYQPQIDLRSGRVTKVEAVLRWQREDDTARLPMEFLELAEQSGLIQPLTRWVLGEAARTALMLSTAAGDRQGLVPLVVTTNLSVRNLFDPDLTTFVELLLRSGELRPELIEIEVAETELMDDPARSQEVLARLSAMGLRFVVDDFGTGYTSLSTMQHLPVVGLKIDRSYVSTIATVPSDAAIVRSTIELSHQLGLSVGADGVPDAATLARLADFGCDLAQGYHLSGPVPLELLPGRIAELETAVRAWIGTADTVDI